MGVGFELEKNDEKSEEGKGEDETHAKGLAVEP